MAQTKKTPSYKPIRSNDEHHIPKILHDKIVIQNISKDIKREDLVKYFEPYKVAENDLKFIPANEEKG